MRVSDFDFHLPEERIALRPARPRDAARMLHVAPNGVFSDRGVRDLPDLLQRGDLMVFNDTRVIPAALKGVRPARAVGGGGPVEVEVNLHKRIDASAWRAFVRPAKRLRTGDRIAFGETLEAEVTGKSEGGDVRLVFNATGPALDAAIAVAGEMPLPPYIARKRGVGEREPWSELPEFFREEVLRGSPDFIGIIPFLRARASGSAASWSAAAHSPRPPRRCCAV